MARLLVLFGLYLAMNGRLLQYIMLAGGPVNTSSSTTAKADTQKSDGKDSGKQNG